MRKALLSACLSALLAFSLIGVSVLYFHQGPGNTNVEQSTTFVTRTFQSTLLTTVTHQSTLAPCSQNCTINLSWEIYASLHELKDASLFIVVGNITSASTVSSSGIPLTRYNVSVLENVKGGQNLTASVLSVAQIGGTVNGNALEIQGYPNLAVGGTYLMFLNYSGTFYPSYYGSSLMTVGGPQGLFPIHGGDVYSLDSAYPQSDAWLPVKVNGVSLSGFVSEIQSS